MIENPLIVGRKNHTHRWREIETQVTPTYEKSNQLKLGSPGFLGLHVCKYFFYGNSTCLEFLSHVDALLMEFQIAYFIQDNSFN